MKLENLSIAHHPEAAKTALIETPKRGKKYAVLVYLQRPLGWARVTLNDRYSSKEEARLWAMRLIEKFWEKGFQLFMPGDKTTDDN